jgi:hypothetical protein
MDSTMDKLKKIKYRVVSIVLASSAFLMGPTIALAAGGTDNPDPYGPPHEPVDTAIDPELLKIIILAGLGIYLISLVLILNTKIIKRKINKNNI